MAKGRRRSRKAEHRALLNANRKHYDAVLEFQGGGCAICGKPPGERRHPLDHDHKAMVMRGILCTACNRRLTTRHTVEWLIGALEYLSNPPWERFKEKMGDS